MKTTLLFAALALSVTALAQEPGRTPATGTPSPTAPSTGAPAQWPSFESLDTNSDGRLSSTEAQASPAVAAKFSTIDKQGRGYVTREEYQMQARMGSDRGTSPGSDTKKE